MIFCSAIISITTAIFKHSLQMQNAIDYLRVLFRHFVMVYLLHFLEQLLLIFVHTVILFRVLQKLFCLHDHVLEFFDFFVHTLKQIVRFEHH